MTGKTATDATTGVVTASASIGANTRHQITVKALFDGAIEATSLPTIRYTLSGAPGDIAVSNETTGGYTLTWTAASSNATKYQLFEGSSSSPVYDGTELNKAITNKGTNISQTYTLYTINADGEKSATSKAATAYTLPAAPVLTMTGTTATSVKVSVAQADKLSTSVTIGGTTKSIANGASAEFTGLTRNSTDITASGTVTSSAGGKTNTGNTTGRTGYFSGGAGTSDNQFEISSLADFNDLRTFVNGNATIQSGTNGTAVDAAFRASEIYYLQTAPITSSGTVDPVGKSAATAFSANYNGQGNTFSGLSLNANGSGEGLFGYVVGATINGINISGCTFNASGNPYQGCIVGDMKGGTVSNCNVSGNIKFTNSSAGSIIGRNDTSAGTISNCSSSATITTKDDITYIGGIVGSMYFKGSTITDCKFTGSITVNKGTYVGGVAGLASKTIIQNCDIGSKSANASITINGHSTLNSSTTGQIGGIVGRLGGVEAKIANCQTYLTLQTTGNANYVGGVVGTMAESEINGITIREETNISSDCDDGTGLIVGRLGALDANVTVANCLIGGTVKAKASVGAIGYISSSSSAAGIKIIIRNIRLTSNANIVATGTTEYTTRTMCGVGGAVGAIILPDNKEYLPDINIYVVDDWSYKFIPSGTTRPGLGGVVGVATLRTGVNMEISSSYSLTCRRSYYGLPPYTSASATQIPPKTGTYPTDFPLDRYYGQLCGLCINGNKFLKNCWYEDSDSRNWTFAYENTNSAKYSTSNMVHNDLTNGLRADDTKGLNQLNALKGDNYPHRESYVRGGTNDDVHINAGYDHSEP